jgi:hypothetical protein
MKLLRLSFVLTVIAFALSLSGVKRKLPENSKENKNGGHKDDGPADNPNPPTYRIENAASPIEVSIIQPSAEDEKNWRNEQKEFWKRQLTLARKLNRITFFAGIVALGGLVFLKLTLDITKEAADAAKDQAIATQKAVNLAEKSFDENVKTVQLDQRAWVGVKEIIFRGQVKPGSQLLATIQIQNTGKTPALEVSIIKAATFKKPTKDSVALLPKVGVFARFVMAPNATFFSIQQFGKRDIEQILQNDVPYIFGKISYKDVFGANRETWFCSFYSEISFPALNFCDTLNHMD